MLLMMIVMTVGAMLMCFSMLVQMTADARPQAPETDQQDQRVGNDLDVAHLAQGPEQAEHGEGL